jgi:tetratricopeptide (TPR) repeat protein
MYLYTNNADQAIVQYKKAIAIKPDLYQPYYNLGVAYGEQGDKGDSAIAFTKAISLAPDDDRKNQAKQAFTKYTGMSADQASKVAVNAARGEGRIGGNRRYSRETAGRHVPFRIRRHDPQHPVRGGRR